MGKIWLFSLAAWHSHFLPSGSAVSAYSHTRISCSERKNHEGTGNKNWTGSISSFHWCVVPILFLKRHIKHFYTCSSCNPIWLCDTISIWAAHIDYYINEHKFYFSWESLKLSSRNSYKYFGIKKTLFNPVQSQYQYYPQTVGFQPRKTTTPEETLQDHGPRLWGYSKTPIPRKLLLLS